MAHGEESELRKELAVAKAELERVRRDAIDEDVQHVVAHGAALIEKPFSAAHLVTEVTRLLVQRGP